MIDKYTVTIPRNIPSGQYLLRAEQLAIHNPGAAPQFYIGCGAVDITGGGSGSPPYFAIPGHIKANDPGVSCLSLLPKRIADIHKQYGDHLYNKGDYDGAMAQYIQTIRYVQPSYVIRKVLLSHVSKSERQLTVP